MATSITVAVASADVAVSSAVSKTLVAPKYMIRMMNDFVFLPHLPSSRIPQQHDYLFGWHQIIASASRNVDFVAACLSDTYSPDLIVAAEIGAVEIASGHTVHCNTVVVWATLLDVRSGHRYHGHSSGVPVEWDQSDPIWLDNVRAHFDIDSNQLINQAVSVCLDQWLRDESPESPTLVRNANLPDTLRASSSSAHIMHIARDCLSAILFYVDEEQIARLEMCNEKIGLLVSSLTRRKRETSLLLFPPSICQKRAPEGVTHFAMRCKSDRTLPKYTPSYDPLLLPSTLTSFRFDGQFSDTLVSCLPQSLTRLSLPNDRAVTNDGVRQLPEGILHLDLRNNDAIDGTIVHALTPRRIQHLQITRCIGAFGDGAVALLCRDLVHLDVRRVEMQPRDIPHFPPNLTYLNCHFVEASFQNEHVMLLPRTLTWLRLKTPLVSDVGMAHLPLSLTYLSMSNGTKITDACIAKLPPSLRTLRLLHGMKLTAACLEHLPRGLLHLSIVVSGNTNNHIARLPPTLQSLSLVSEDDCISDERAAHLPRSLTSLRLHWNNCLTDAAVGQLPRALTRLSMPDNELWTDACVPNLPPSLTSLELGSNRLLTSACLGNMPRSLTFLGLKLNTNIVTADVARSLSHVENVMVNRCSHCFGKPCEY